MGGMPHLQAIKLCAGTLVAAERSQHHIRAEAALAPLVHLSFTLASDVIVWARTV